MLLALKTQNAKCCLHSKCKRRDKVRDLKVDDMRATFGTVSPDGTTKFWDGYMSSCARTHIHIHVGPLYALDAIAS